MGVPEALWAVALDLMGKCEMNRTCPSPGLDMAHLDGPYRKFETCRADDKAI